MILGKRFHLSHGDGLGPGDRGYKFLKAVFSCRFCQRLFAALHPATGMRLANYFSRKSRLANRPSDEQFLGEDKEWLVIYSKELLKKRHVDYFVYGHRHVPVNIEIAPGVRYINTGDWYNHYSYAVFDGSRMELLSFTGAPHAEDH